MTVLDPNGDIAGNFDESPRGADPVQLDTEVAGRYHFQIAPADEEVETPGSFTFALERIEPKATDPAKRLDQLLSAFAGVDTPGAVVAVMRDGKITHSQAVGMANLTHNIPFERGTVSNIGSVSKQFTAFAVTQLAAATDLSLDDDVRKYFPELPNLGQTVTVRNLLNHTSGYREFLNLLALSGVRLDKGDWIDRDDVLRILERQPALQDEPGTLFNYNNTAYSLAALLVERLTDQPLNEWMAENVVAPLGMSHTRIRANLGEVVPNSADGYVYAEEAPYREAIDLGGGGGATMGPGGVYTTVDDMAHWINNLHTARVGGAGVVGEMTKPQIKAPGGEDNHYGFGLSLETYRGQPLIQHGGADTAHRAMMLFFPEINAAVFAMSNNGAFPSNTIARRTADAFFADDLEPQEDEQVAAAGDGAQSDSPSGAETSDSRIDPALFDPHLGKYELETFYTVEMGEDGLQVKHRRLDDIDLSPKVRDSFSATFPITEVAFDRDETGTLTGMRVSNIRTQDIWFKRQ